MRNWITATLLGIVKLMKIRLESSLKWDIFIVRWLNFWYLPNKNP